MFTKLLGVLFLVALAIPMLGASSCETQVDSALGVNVVKDPVTGASSVKVTPVEQTLPGQVIHVVQDAAPAPISTIFLGLSYLLHVAQLFLAQRAASRQDVHEAQSPDNAHASTPPAPAT